MTLSMTDEIRRALANAGREPVTVVDPQSDAAYVLIPIEDYARMRSEDGEEINGTYAAQDVVAGSHGWNDPGMDDYDDYDAHRS